MDKLPYLLNSILSLFFVISYSVAQNFEHVEPPFWWEGMNHHQVEIMFHGKNIAALTPTSKTMLITGVKKTENPNYLFVSVETKNLEAGTYQIQFLNEKKKVVIDYAYVLKQRENNSAQRSSFSSEDVIYLLMPDRFANGNPTNDSHSATVEKANRANPGGRHGGDIQGIIDHLDYIHELGATAVWSTPLLEDNDSSYSYHTYGQSDVYKIDPRYGTNEDYVRLSEEMHKRNMKLIMDYVTNHWGGAHWMMKDLPTYEWIHQFPGYAQSNYRMSTQMDAYASARDFKYCMNGWFVKSMPDLNQSNPLVLTYLTQNAIWWIEYAKLDGFRVDTYSYNDKEGIAKWTKAITDEYPNFTIVGEVWLHDQAQISYWQKNSPISAIQHYNTYLPAVMDFTLHDAFGQLFKENNQNWDQGMVRVYENLVNDFLYSNPDNLLIFTENHDTQRFNEIYKNLEAYKMGITLLATLRGIPQLYYGSEIGMAGDKSNGDAAIRQDFPGGWKSDAKNAFTKEGRTTEQEAYFSFTAKLMNWRKSKAVIHFGKTMQFLPENNVHVYFRYDDKDTVMVIINNSDKQQTLQLDRFAEILPKNKSAKDLISGFSFNTKEKSYSIPAKTSAIIEFD